MKKALIGAGGFAREVKAQMNYNNMVMFVDDEFYKPNNDNILPLSSFDSEDFEVLVAIGNPKERYEMVKRLGGGVKYFSFIHPSVQLLSKDTFTIGNGTFICAGCIITTDVLIGDHCHLNLQTTIGHNTSISDFFTSAPGVKISGDCFFWDRVYLGTNTSVREKITICSDVTVGLNSGIVKNITESGTYVGSPAKKIK